MRAAYKGKPLTDEEAVDVTAFLAGSREATAPRQAGFAWLGLAGFVLLMLFIWPFYPKNRSTYWDRLRRKK